MFCKGKRHSVTDSMDKRVVFKLNIKFSKVCKLLPQAKVRTYIEQDSTMLILYVVYLHSFLNGLKGDLISLDKRFLFTNF